MVHGEADIISSTGRWHGAPRLSTRKLSFYPCRDHRDLGATALTILLGRVVRVSITPFSKHLCIREVNGLETRFLGRSAMKAYRAFGQDICAAKVGPQEGNWSGISCFLPRLIFAALGFTLLFFLRLLFFS